MTFRRHRARILARSLAALAFIASATALHAQHATGHTATADTSSTPGIYQWSDVQARIGLMAIGLLSRVSPAYDGRDFTEGYLTQPNLMMEVRWRPLTFFGTLNAEGYTLKRGELTPGIYGEGYVDRRHPHTLLHEAMLSLSLPSQDDDGLAASLSIGKGFAPFGTDDPMMRPFAKYPVNHHHAQILERVQVTGALRFARGERDVTIEAGVFNGDEPTDPFSAPRVSRLGDSRAARLTVRPLRGVEAQVSGAYVESPGIIQGGASNHDQRSASLRWDGTLRGSARGYAFAEFAHTSESEAGHHEFTFESMLIEGSATWSRVSLAARWERTDRPEEERLLDPFRTPVGHIGFQLLGITRWNTTTVQLGGPGFVAPRSVGGFRLIPFVEVVRAVPSAVVHPTVFEPELFYGSRALWSYSIGLRLHAGAMRSRMGRYGVAMPRTTTQPTSHQH